MAFLLACPATDASGHAKREVFIYYANETGGTPSELLNYRTVIDWLRSTDNTKARTIASQLEQDLQSFPARIEAEVAKIVEGLPKTSPDARGVVFTNRLTRSGKCLVLSGAGKFEEAPFAPPDATEPILQSNPLSNPLALRAIFREVARRFDPGQHEFILVTHSHGSATMAVTPRLAIWHERTNREEVLAAVAQELTEAQVPSWIKSRPGITRDVYFEEIKKAGGELGMTFKLILDKSCDGVLSENQVRRLPDNIRNLYLSGSLQYGSPIDFVPLLARLAPNESLEDRLGRSLSGRYAGYMVDGQRNPQADDALQRTPGWTALLYFLPLALWLTWFGWRRRWRGASKSSGNPPSVTGTG